MAALRELYMLDGFVPSEVVDDKQRFAGVWARTGVYIGSYRNLPIMRRAAHERRYCVVAPNSTWLPRQLIEEVSRHAHFVSPSHWGAGVIETQCHMHDYAAAADVSVWKHGVDPGFRPIERLADAAREVFRNGGFRVLHLSSSALERKGTSELLEAWGMFCEDEWCAHPELVVVAPETATELREKASRCCPEGTVWFMDRLDASVERMNVVYQECHLICQPSRGEGFGMVPLEARAAGVPVLMTTCTGHAEHAGPRSHPDDRLGVIEVMTGDLAPIDDGPGALAPSLDVKTLYVALVGARADWLAYKQDTVQAAAGVSERWSWRRVTEDWLRSIGLIAGGGADGDSEGGGSG